MGFWAWVFVACCAWFALNGLFVAVLWWGSKQEPVPGPCEELLRVWARGL